MSEIKPLSNVIIEWLRGKYFGNAARRERCRSSLWCDLGLIDYIEDPRDGFIIFISSPGWLMEGDVEKVEGSRANTRCILLGSIAGTVAGLLLEVDDVWGDFLPSLTPIEGREEAGMASR